MDWKTYNTLKNEQIADLEAEVTRLRERAERVEKALRGIMSRISVGIGCNLYCSDWPGLPGAMSEAWALLAGLDAAPAGEGNLCPMCKSRPVSTSLGFCSWCDDTQGEDPSELLARLAAKPAGSGGSDGDS